ncbi:HAMP domain-containing sensor histidine kinase [Flexistipes sinusarabici]|uniref:histidine kinase n=1 Tax=Flexistipes sinusarabici TaxID=2352 RepID=A0A3D5QBA7_FLESI|nr:HAMP domain-containing sensor histidine kinase [Flexistipes sinusarabici]HCW92998.1 hypothetical protein [Flexistipes sinusarabici]
MFRRINKTKIKILNLSLKWRIIIFYFFFGFIPLVFISYYSFFISSKSISSTTEKQVKELMNGVSQRMDAFYYKIKGDIYQLSDNPIVQLVFLQFSYSQRVQYLWDKLAKYRTNSVNYDRISLYTPTAELVLTTPKVNRAESKRLVSTSIITDAFSRDFSLYRINRGEAGSLLFIKRVYDFENNEEPVGLVIYEISNDMFTDFLDQVDIGEGIVKSIIGKNGEKIYEHNEGNVNKSTLSDSSFVKYSTNVSSLGWDISISIPEKVLFEDIYNLRNKSLFFSILVALIAFTSALFFIKRILVPIRKVIDGTKRFAEGDLDYRINLETGKELKVLSEAFNNMAQQLQSRQNELIQTNKLVSLGLLSASIAHEIKNPLAGIKTSVQAISKRKIYESSEREILNNVTSEVDRLNKIVTEMLNFAKPVPSVKSNVRIDAVVEKALTFLANDLKNKKVKVYNRLKPSEKYLDEDQFLQILINLMLNALASIKTEGGFINIHQENDSGEVLIIEDNGIGIPEDKLDKIYDPFFSMSKEGTGLGLSVVYSLAKQNNIDIEIDSAENAGTKVKLKFKGDNENG